MQTLLSQTPAGDVPAGWPATGAGQPPGVNGLPVTLGAVQLVNAFTVIHAPVGAGPNHSNTFDVFYDRPAGATQITFHGPWSAYTRAGHSLLVRHQWLARNDASAALDTI